MLCDNLVLRTLVSVNRHSIRSIDMITSKCAIPSLNNSISEIKHCICGDGHFTCCRPTLYSFFSCCVGVCSLSAFVLPYAVSAKKERLILIIEGIF